MCAADTAVDQQAGAAYEQGDAQGYGGEDVVLYAQGAAAYGRGHDGGDARHGGYPQPGPGARARQRGEIAQQVLRGAGYEHQQEHEGVPFVLAAQEVEGFYFFAREKYLHGTHAEAADKEVDDHAACRGADKAEQRALHGAEGVARANLHGLARDDGDEHLQKLHAQEPDAAHQPAGVHPGAEMLGLGDEFKHGPPHEPGYGRRQQDEDGDGGRGYYFLGFFRQLRPVVRRHSPLPCGKYF